MMPVALGNHDSRRDCGLILVGHGTRDERGLSEFRCVAQQVANLADEFLVESCCLELAMPDVPTAVRRLVERGARRLIVAPLMLFAAGHVKRDIPRAVQQALVKETSNDAFFAFRRAQSEGWAPSTSNEFAIKYLPALECDLRILQLSEQRFNEALAGNPEIDPADTLLLLVARGSSSPEATAMAHHFAELRAQSASAARVEACFVAKAQPSLESALAQASRSRFSRIVFQPHLLFAGQVLEEVKQVVERIRVHGASLAAGTRDSSADHDSLNREWILTAHLGTSPLIAKAIGESATAAMQLGLV
jgi:sirohydrochlorin cobaltochelatase